jgi:hypothetical protein
MKIKSFGCSFVYGSELQPNSKDSNCIDNDLSHDTWPSLMADYYKTQFENYAYPGIGNLRIFEQILAQSEMQDPAFFIINWTWLDRFDFLQPVTEQWNTLRPDGDTKLHNIYYKHFYNQYHTMLTNASYILTAINTLTVKQIPFCMTLMDTTLFDPIDPNWQDPYALRSLQTLIKPHIMWFDNLDFLSWSRKNNYPISSAWHPLEPAHRAAADYMISVFDTQKISDLIQQVHVPSISTSGISAELCGLQGQSKNLLKETQ